MLAQAARQVGKLGAYLAIVLAVVAGGFLYSHEIDELHGQAGRLAAADAAQRDTQAQLTGQVARLEEVNRLGTHGSCVARNRLRDGIVGFVGESLPRSKRALDATVASPTATAQQKFTALVNYAQLRRVYEALRRRLPLEKCPPEPKGISP